MKSDTALAIATALRPQFERPEPSFQPQFEVLRHNLAEGVLETSQSVVPTLAFGTCRGTVERRINDDTLVTPCWRFRGIHSGLGKALRIDHQKQFGHAPDGVQRVEIANIPSPPSDGRRGLSLETLRPSPCRFRSLADLSCCALRFDAPVYSRELLGVGNQLTGPAAHCGGSARHQSRRQITAGRGRKRDRGNCSRR